MRSPRGPSNSSYRSLFGTSGREDSELHAKHMDTVRRVACTISPTHRLLRKALRRLERAGALHRSMKRAASALLHHGRRAFNSWTAAYSQCLVMRSALQSMHQLGVRKAINSWLAFAHCRGERMAALRIAASAMRFLFCGIDKGVLGDATSLMWQ